jgi:hypothetical protein
MTTLSITLARSSDGSVDESATLAECQSAIRKYVAERETEQATIALAVSDVFDSLKGARANMPYVVNSALRGLNAQPENFKALSERVADYLRSHAGDRASGALFHIGKGKTGGVTRWADQPEPAAK